LLQIFNDLRPIKTFTPIEIIIGSQTSKISYLLLVGTLMPSKIKLKTKIYSPLPYQFVTGGVVNAKGEVMLNMT